VNQNARKALITPLSAIGIAAAFAALNFFRWMHRASPEARFETRLWLILFAVSVVVAIARILYYRTHRDYFAEEVEHRSSLAKGR
jgi:hypothetical protein